MKRRLWFWVGLSAILLVIVASVFALVSFGSPKHLADYLISDDEWTKIKSARTKNWRLNPGEIILENTPLQLDSMGQRLFYSVNPNQHPSTNPTIKILDESMHFATRSGELSFDNISANRPVEVLVYNDKFYNEMFLTLTSLPVLSIDTQDTTEIGEDDVAVQLKLNDHGSITSSKSNIHVRGGYMKGLEKKSYKLSLLTENNKKNKVSLLGMRSDDDWILNSLYSDIEKVREIMATRLWRDCCKEHNQANADNTFDYRYVEVFMNNEYHGLYLLGYKPDNKILGIKSGEILFKDQDWVNAKIFREDRNLSHTFFKIETSVADETAAYDELQTFLDVLERGNPAEVRTHFDMANAIDIELHTILTAHGDFAIENGELKNNYMAIKQFTDRRYIIITPWDFDFCFDNLAYYRQDNVDPKRYVERYSSYLPTMGLPVSVLFDHHDATIRQELNDRYAELRKGAWSNEHILQLIDEVESDIFGSGAYQREISRWPDSNYINDISNLDLFREYMTKRLEFLDAKYDFKN